MKRITSIALALILVLLLLLAAAAGFAYYSGFGWPTQESVVEDVFAEKTNNGDVNKYLAPSLSSESKQFLVQMIPGGASVKITGVNRAMSNSEVMVIATLAEGG